MKYKQILIKLYIFSNLFMHTAPENKLSLIINLHGLAPFDNAYKELQLTSPHKV